MQSTTHAKGKVERPFFFAETNLLSGREFRSLEHLNEVTAWWLAEVADVRVHRQTRRRPIDLYAEELPHLIPLPERPYEVAEVVYRTVDAEGMVTYGQNRYSVPWQYIGQVLPLRITDEEVTIYGPRLESLTRHWRFPPTERHRESRQREHLPPRDVTQRRAVLRERFAQLGSVAVRFSPRPAPAIYLPSHPLVAPVLPCCILRPIAQPLTRPPLAAKVAPFPAANDTTNRGRRSAAEIPGESNSTQTWR